jgi:hypothetical protein
VVGLFARRNARKDSRALWYCLSIALDISHERLDVLLAFVLDLSSCPAPLDAYFQAALQSLDATECSSRFLTYISGVEDPVAHQQKAAAYDLIASFLLQVPTLPQLTPSLFLGCLQLLSVTLGSCPSTNLNAYLERLLLPVLSIEQLSTPASDDLSLRLLQTLTLTPVTGGNSKPLVDWLLTCQKKSDVEMPSASPITALRLNFYAFVRSE